MIDDKVWQRVDLRAGPFWLAETTPELCAKLRTTRVECAFYGMYALLSAQGALRYGDVDGMVHQPSYFGIDPVELSYVVLRREVKRAVNEAFEESDDDDDDEDDDFWSGSSVWNELLTRWKRIDDLYDADPTFLFSSDLLLFCLKNNMDIGMHPYLGNVRVTVYDRKSIKKMETVDGVWWRHYNGYKMTKATDGVLEALKHSHETYVRVLPVVYVYTSEKCDMKKLRTFYTTVREERKNICRGVEEETARSKAVSVYQSDFLSKSNFYDVIAEQIKENPDQTAFYFEKSGNFMNDQIFANEIDGNDQFFRRSLPFAHVCFLKGVGPTCTDGWVLIMVVMTVLISVTFGSIMWFVITDSPSSIIQHQYYRAVGALCCCLVADAFGALCYFLFLCKRAKKLVLYDQ